MLLNPTLTLKTVLTIGEALTAGERELASLEQPKIEAERLLAYVLEENRSFLYAKPFLLLTENQYVCYSQYLQRRKEGEPFAYIIGQQEFWSLDFCVSPATLIPRPETELLVELTLALFPVQPPKKILELGTGSGAIAIAIAKERATFEILATDISEQSLSVAALNAAKHQLKNLDFLSDWFLEVKEQSFDLIISNPPYIAEGEWHLYEQGLQFEPKLALVSGDDGLQAIRTLIHHARNHLKSGGYLLLEHGYQQGMAISALLQLAGYREITGFKDLAGHDRVTMACWR